MLVSEVRNRHCAPPWTISASGYQIELDLQDHRRLYVSGMANIDANGKTVHIGDPESQVEMTMKIVRAILA